MNEIAKGIAWGEFHQHVYAQLLRTQIPKVQKDSQIIMPFSTFEISVHKTCSLNIDAIDPRSNGRMSDRF